jgi:hypothetical protein
MNFTKILHTVYLADIWSQADRRTGSPNTALCFYLAKNAYTSVQHLTKYTGKLTTNQVYKDTLAVQRIPTTAEGSRDR